MLNLRREAPDKERFVDSVRIILAWLEVSSMPAAHVAALLGVQPMTVVNWKRGNVNVRASKTYRRVYPRITALAAVIAEFLSGRSVGPVTPPLPETNIETLAELGLALGYAMRVAEQNQLHRATQAAAESGEPGPVQLEFDFG